MTNGHLTNGQPKPAASLPAGMRAPVYVARRHRIPLRVFAVADTGGAVISTGILLKEGET